MNKNTRRSRINIKLTVDNTKAHQSQAHPDMNKVFVTHLRPGMFQQIEVSLHSDVMRRKLILRRQK